MNAVLTRTCATPPWLVVLVDSEPLDLSGLGVLVLDDETHRRANVLSHAWETINAWAVEPDYAARRLAALRALTS